MSQSTKTSWKISTLSNTGSPLTPSHVVMERLAIEAPAKYLHIFLSVCFFLSNSLYLSLPLSIVSRSTSHALFLFLLTYLFVFLQLFISLPLSLTCQSCLVTCIVHLGLYIWVLVSDCFSNRHKSFNGGFNRRSDLFQHQLHNVPQQLSVP